MKSILLAFVIGLAVSQCPSNDPYCGKCSGSVCQYCWDSYLTTTGTCARPTINIINCQSYASPSLCAACVDDYYIEANGSCSRIPDNNCASFIATTGCIACKNGVRVVNGTCNNANTCGTPNCNVCLESNICAKCNSGYVLSANNTCIQGAPAVANCMVATQLGCSLCQRGYYDMNGVCAQSGVTAPTSSAARMAVGLVFGFFATIIL